LTQQSERVNFYGGIELEIKWDFVFNPLIRGSSLAISYGISFTVCFTFAPKCLERVTPKSHTKYEIML
jgi:hypothetical protein